MIDLHCHLLPNIDDGPTSLDDSLRMASMAVENGISRSIVTPHIHAGRYANDLTTIQQASNSFIKALQENSIPLEIGFAAEVRIGPEILNMVTNDAIPFLGQVDDYRVLLLEFPHEGIPVGSENLVDWLLARKIRPMIAHPERNKMVMRNLDEINPYVKKGCLLQLTAASVAGNFGPQAHAAAVRILQNNWAYVLATDAHNIDYRYPDLAAGRDAAADIIGSEAARKLVEDNPRTLLGIH